MMVAAEGTIESFLFGSAFKGLTEECRLEKFTAADGRWGLSNVWKEPNGAAAERNYIHKTQKQENPEK